MAMGKSVQQAGWVRHPYNCTLKMANDSEDENKKVQVVETLPEFALTSSNRQSVYDLTETLHTQ
eukprot:8716868-Prorocentrum_lima.AAC.1